MRPPMNYTLLAQADHDLPTLWLSDGKYFLDVGKHTWRGKWGEFYQHRVHHWEAPLGGNEGNQDQSGLPHKGVLSRVRC